MTMSSVGSNFVVAILLFQHIFTISNDCFKPGHFSSSSERCLLDNLGKI